MLKMEGVFPRLMLIIAHLSYGNAKIIINFASLFQMLKSWCRERMKLGLEFLQMKGVGHVFLVLIITDVLHSLGDVLKDIHGLLGLIVFKEELGAHIVYVNLNLASNMQKKEYVAGTENVYLMFTAIIQRMYAGDVPNHMNGSLPSVIDVCVIKIRSKRA